MALRILLASIEVPVVLTRKDDNFLHKCYLLPLRNKKVIFWLLILVFLFSLIFAVGMGILSFILLIFVVVVCCDFFLLLCLMNCIKMSNILKIEMKKRTVMFLYI